MYTTEQSKVGICITYFATCTRIWTHLKYDTNTPGYKGPIHELTWRVLRTTQIQWNPYKRKKKSIKLVKPSSELRYVLALRRGTNYVSLYRAVFDSANLWNRNRIFKEKCCSGGCSYTSTRTERKLEHVPQCWQQNRKYECTSNTKESWMKF